MCSRIDWARRQNPEDISVPALWMAKTCFGRASLTSPICLLLPLSLDVRESENPAVVDSGCLATAEHYRLATVERIVTTEDPSTENTVLVLAAALIKPIGLRQPLLLCPTTCSIYSIT
jgi:hypothetical protein